MVTVRIGDDERTFSSRGEIDEAWINQQINRRRVGGQQVCVRVHVEADGMRLGLQTPGCPSWGSRSVSLNVEESKMVELWNARGLGRVDFTGGNLIAFLKQLEYLK